MLEKKIENFSEDQKNALKAIEEFKKIPIDKNNVNSRVFVLSGPAGSGKTTLIKYALSKELNEDMSYFNEDMDIFYKNSMNVCGVTLSHKAKNVLKKSIINSKTYASFFGLKEQHNPDGTRVFVKQLPNPLNPDPCYLPHKFVVHDEVSMYDMEMIKIILDETSLSSKIILMGDINQIPPINTLGDLDSPAFTLFENTFYLTERHRQTNENPILELSDLIIEEIQGSQNLNRVLEAFKETKFENGIGYRNIPYSKFLNDYKNISKDYTDTKVIAYRNEKVNIFNVSIRNHIYSKPDKPFIPEEIIYMNDSFVKEKNSKQGKGEKQWTFFNSDEYVIKSVNTDNYMGIDVYLVYVYNNNHHHLRHVKEPYMRIVSPSGMKKFNEISFFRKKEAINEPNSRERSKKWKFYYDFISQFANVSYGYCYTGHKIQGSGYKNIYVDVNDIITVGPISDKRKLQSLYTAITRATHSVIFLTNK